MNRECRRGLRTQPCPRVEDQCGGEVAADLYRLWPFGQEVRYPAADEGFQSQVSQGA